MEQKGNDLKLDNSAGANSALSNEALAAAAGSQTNSSLANSGRETTPPNQNELAAIRQGSNQGAAGTSTGNQA